MSLLSQLQTLGEALPVNAQPTAASLDPIVAGLVYYLETGSLAAPVVAEPEPQAVAAATAENTIVARLETQLKEAQDQLEAAQAAPSPVAPAPPAPAPPPAEPAPAAPAASEAPTPTPPAPSVGS